MGGRVNLLKKQVLIDIQATLDRVEREQRSGDVSINLNFKTGSITKAAITETKPVIVQRGI
jgi:hypothetical protein